MITCVHECSRSRGLEWQIFLSYQRFKFYRSCQWHQKFISTAHAKLSSSQFLIETSFILLHVIWWFVWFCLHICLLIIKIMLLITWWPYPNFSRSIWRTWSSLLFLFVRVFGMFLNVPEFFWITNRLKRVLIRTKTLTFRWFLLSFSSFCCVFDTNFSVLIQMYR